MYGLKLPIRPIDMALVVASCAIIFAVALTSLFEQGEPASYMRQDCELFYGHEGAGAVQHCIAETRTGRTAIPRP